MNLHKLREELLHSGKLHEFLEQIGEIRHNAGEYKPFPRFGEPSGDKSEWLTARRYEQTMEMREWAHKIPSLQFPADWHVTIIPPFSGASVRFFVSLEKLPLPRADARDPASVSVYLDCYGNLGMMNLEKTPYWEVYPVAEDTARFALDEVDELLECIGAALARQDSNTRPGE